MGFIRFICLIYRHLTKSRLKRQVKGYLEFRKSTAPLHVMDDRDALHKLVRCCECELVTMAALKRFKEAVIDKMSGSYGKVTTLTIIRTFLKYLRVNGYECPPPECIGTDSISFTYQEQNVRMVFMQKTKFGRKPNIALIRKVKALRSILQEDGTPMSYRKISEAVERNISLVHKWCNSENFKDIV